MENISQCLLVSLLFLDVPITVIVLSLRLTSFLNIFIFILRITNYRWKRLPVWHDDSISSVGRRSSFLPLIQALTILFLWCLQLKSIKCFAVFWAKYQSSFSRTL